MNCPFCSASLQPGSGFCNACGGPLAEPESVNVVVQGRPGTDPVYVSMKVPKRGVCIGAGITALVTSVFWLLPLMLLLVAGSAADLPGKVMGVIVLMTTAAVIGMVCGGMAIRAKPVALYLIIGSHVILVGVSILVSLALFDSPMGVPILRVLASVGTIVVAIVAMPQAYEYSKSPLGF